ncbi:RNA-binding protein 24-B [Trifolium pratense]|uniref:Uncharacterized protein n=2 Tax=Trifolium pratense TaxID=57577 RepID=A0ACB0LDF8_TRIPR|nr:RNA-binding protein 38-like [Trifolium pratense]PNX76741.1 RNA-binding protein 24-B [Trifolium pratense]CAJ2667346.1 unnamed protein product [Trifolium pratense]
MSHTRQNKMMSPNVVPRHVGDTTYTKIFVGGLAWETKRDTLKRYFDQFGDILEAVVITDRATGKSKGYGFVTFKDPNSAILACQNPNPVIDGRRANCNLASQQSDSGKQKINSPSWTNAPIQLQGSSIYYNQHVPQYAYPYPVYRYPQPGYLRPQDIYEMSYNAYGGPQFPYRWIPAYYQPYYGLSRQLIPTTLVKKTQFHDVVGISGTISPSTSISSIGAATRVVESPKDQTSSS